MNLADPRTFELFLEIYGTLPRAGPGSTEDTLHALSLTPNGNPATILDLGCGPGAQTLALAEALPDASIKAMDLTPQMATEARRRVEAADYDNRVRVETGDMMSPKVPKASQDLIWCEGAIYFAGVEPALRTWKPLLTPNGAVAFTEPIWIHPSPPEDLVAWWREEYPAITDEAGVRTAVQSAGFSTVGSFVLPAGSWWKEYYTPMEERVEEFLAAHSAEPLAAEIAAEATKEIETFRRFSDFYSYGFFIVQPRREV
jgi:trans-aconitate methyltransferase